MRILAIGDPHGDIDKIKKIPIKNIDLILLTGDLGKADFARKHFFDNLKRKQKGLPEKEYTKEEMKKVYNEIYNSSTKILNYLANFSKVNTILGNVGESDSETRKKEKEHEVKLPRLIKGINNIENVNLTKNRIRNFNSIRIGFLEYFVDTSWVKEFKPKDYREKLKEAKKESNKAKNTLRRFQYVDILLCHQPPYGILDKVTSRYSPPKSWIGKRAGSKVILEYIKKYQPKYVFCGHIHEAEGFKKLGNTEIYNLGVGGYKIIDIQHAK